MKSVEEFFIRVIAGVQTKSQCREKKKRLNNEPYTELYRREKKKKRLDNEPYTEL